MKSKNVKSLKELKSHPLVEEVWKEHQDGQYDDCDEVFWLTLKSGYFFKHEQTSLITTRGFVSSILAEFNFLQPTICKDDRE
jgi:hypothetical protein